MIENDKNCYLFKQRQTDGARLYKRAYPNESELDPIEKWNTISKLEAGILPKADWLKRCQKWAFKQGWMLESITGEVEAI